MTERYIYVIILCQVGYCVEVKESVRSSNVDGPYEATVYPGIDSLNIDTAVVNLEWRRIRKYHPFDN